MNRTGKRQKARGKREIRLIFIFYCLLLLAFGLPLSGCGKKGDVRAPELVIPETIRNLTARQDKAGVALTWSRPTQYVDGQALKDLTQAPHVPTLVKVAALRLVEARTHPE